MALGRVCLDFAMLTERLRRRKVLLAVRGGSKAGGADAEDCPEEAGARNYRGFLLRLCRAGMVVLGQMVAAPGHS